MGRSLKFKPTYTFIILIMLTGQLPIFADGPDSIADIDKTYLQQLYQQEDYYRAISEGYKLKFDHENRFDPEIDLILLRSHYQMGNHTGVIRNAKELLMYQKPAVDDPVKYQVGTLLTASLLNLGNTQQAGEAWHTYCQFYNDESFPQLDTFPEKIDPNKAKLYSAILPGSGLALSGEYGKATISFLLNAVFLAGIYHYASDRQYGIAAVLSFFEIGWYFGGQNASYEYAVRFNQQHIKFKQQTWINNKLNQSGMKIK